MTRRLFASALAAASLLTALGCGNVQSLPSPSPAARPDGIQLEMRYRGPADLAKAESLGFDLFGFEADKNIAVGQVDRQGLEALKRAGVPFKVLPAQMGAKNNFDKGYRTYEQVKRELHQLADKHPQIMNLRSLGKSWETTQGKADRDIWGVRITGPGDASKRPGVVFTANLHARELVTVEVAMRLIAMLLEGYEKDPKIKQLVDTRAIYLAPMVNPDGHVQAEKGHNWRKNTHPFTGGVGVDLNRNFPFKWDLKGNGSETDPSSEIFKGPAPASEPETQAVKAFISGIPNLKIGMDYHSYSNLIMWSWGWTSSPPPDAKLLSTIGHKLASFNGYKPTQASGLYPTSGTIRDFVYGELGVPYFTTEIGSRWDGFDPPYSRVEKLWEEQRQGALYLIDIADDPSQVLR